MYISLHKHHHDALHTSNCFNITITHPTFDIFTAAHTFKAAVYVTPHTEK